MRRLPAFVAVTALAGFGLVGCSASAGASCPTPTADPALSAAISATGDVGTAPTVNLRSPYLPTQTAVDTLVQGDGQKLTEDGQQAFLDVTVVNAATGETAIATPYAADFSRPLTLLELEKNIPDVGELLHCAAEGSRVAVALPSDTLPAEQAQGLGLTAGAPAVFVFDVRKVFLPAADGVEQFNAGTGMPSVVRAPSGQPGVSFPQNDAPTDVRTETLKKGDGEVLTADSNVMIHVLGVAWGAKTTFFSTWENGAPGQATASQLPPSLASALEGQTVGSQVLVVVPADQTSADQQALRAPADKALVYVVDILGTVG